MNANTSDQVRPGAARVGIEWSDDSRGVDVVMSARGRVIYFPCSDEDEARALADYIIGRVNGPDGDAEVEAMLASEANQ